jgi:hypothetical protein
VEAIELDETTGDEITNGHQNGESPTPSTQSTADVSLGPIVAQGPGGQASVSAALGGWVGAGAASATASREGDVARIRFAASGLPGVVRPRQPSDSRALPVLSDRQTAAAAGPDGRLQMTIDGQPVRARVVGVLKRFPTLSGNGSFVIADQAVLAAALDAQLPGQGRPDELWIARPRTRDLQAALNRPALTQLHATFRSEVEHGLRAAPVARAMTGTLLAAAAVSGVLALVGLLLVVHGPLRDRRLEEDLAAQGLGPAALRAELVTRVSVAGVLGIIPGVALALLLDRLAVAAVGAVGSGQRSVPPPVTVVPGLALAVWAAGAAVCVLVAAWLASRWLGRGGTRTRPRRVRSPGVPEDGLREEWAR